MYVSSGFAIELKKGNSKLNILQDDGISLTFSQSHLMVNRPSKIAQEVALLTCNTLQECQKSMRMHGWAILKDMTTVFYPRHRCTQQQRDFINQYVIDKGLEVVFEDGCHS